VSKSVIGEVKFPFDGAIRAIKVCLDKLAQEISNVSQNPPIFVKTDQVHGPSYKSSIQYVERQYSWQTNKKNIFSTISMASKALCCVHPP
jgi:hypothetical protein